MGGWALCVRFWEGKAPGTVRGPAPGIPVPVACLVSSRGNRRAGLQLPLLVLLVLLVDAEVVLDHVAALIDLVAELTAELVLGDVLGLLDPVPHLVLVLSGEVLGLVDEHSEVWHRVYPRIACDSFLTNRKALITPPHLGRSTGTSG